MIGQQISHNRILDKLGQGGMGVAYRAHDDELNRRVALEVLPPATAPDAKRRARLLKQARSASALNHPNVVTMSPSRRRANLSTHGLISSIAVWLTALPESLQ